MEATTGAATTGAATGAEAARTAESAASVEAEKGSSRGRKGT